MSKPTDTHETVEQFLARGGTIQQIPAGHTDQEFKIYNLAENRERMKRARRAELIRNGARKSRAL